MSATDDERPERSAVERDGEGLTVEQRGRLVALLRAPRRPKLVAPAEAAS